MLDAEYLAKIAEGAEAISSNLHEYLINEIVSRMMERIGRGESYLLTSSDAWRIQILQDAGYLLEDIQKEIAKYTNLQLKEVQAIMEEAGIEAVERDAAVYRAAGLSPTPLPQSPALIRILERDMAATMGSWQNFARTTANSAQRLFINECDNAYHKVISGAESYSKAVKDAVESVVTDGVTVDYPSGRKLSIEAATAMVVRTGVAQASGDISLERMEEMEWDTILVSAHIGARTGDGKENAGNHHWWQGKFYSRSGEDDRFPPFSQTGYGTGEGLCGWNCRHSFGSGNGIDNPFESLREADIADAGKTEELEQRQRLLERRVRKTKREVMGLQTAVDKCMDADAKHDLQMDLNRKSALLQKQNKAYRDYCESNGLRTQNERLQIAQWNREQAAKARSAAAQYRAAH